MDKITIADLEVFFCVGVTEEERARPQRLLLTVEWWADFHAAAAADDLGHTIDYWAVTQRIRQTGDGAHWRLIETLAVDLADMVQSEFNAGRVAVEVKKFIIPETRYVSARVERAARP